MPLLQAVHQYVTCQPAQLMLGPKAFLPLPLALSTLSPSPSSHLTC